MTTEQIIELVEKWLADNSSVTAEELETAYAAGWAAYATAADAATADATDAACAAADATDAACAAAADAWATHTAADAEAIAADAATAAKHVAEYRELTKQAAGKRIAVIVNEFGDELSDAASHAARNGEAYDLRAAADAAYAADLAVYDATHTTADELAKIEKQARCRDPDEFVSRGYLRILQLLLMLVLLSTLLSTMN